MQLTVSQDLPILLSRAAAQAAPACIIAKGYFFPGAVLSIFPLITRGSCGPLLRPVWDPLNGSPVIKCNPETSLSCLKKALSAYPSRTWHVPPQTPTTMPPLVASPLVLTHKLSPNLLSVLYKSSLRLSCCFMQRTPPPAPLSLSSLPVFPEELVPVHCRSPATSCPTMSQSPCISFGKEALATFCRLDHIALILSL